MQLLQVTAIQTDIDRHTLHVVTAFGNATTLLAEQGVGLGGALSGNDLESLLAFDLVL